MCGRIRNPASVEVGLNFNFAQRFRPDRSTSSALGCSEVRIPVLINVVNECVWQLPVQVYV